MNEKYVVNIGDNVQIIENPTDAMKYLTKGMSLELYTILLLLGMEFNFAYKVPNMKIIIED